MISENAKVVEIYVNTDDYNIDLLNDLVSMIFGACVFMFLISFEGELASIQHSTLASSFVLSYVATRIVGRHLIGFTNYDQ